MRITVETTVAAPIDQVWRAYTTPADIVKWNAASDDWHTTKATVDLREGGAFSSRMEAKDGSMGFDFAGTYTKIVEHRLIEYAFGDQGRSSLRARTEGRRRSRCLRCRNDAPGRAAAGRLAVDSRQLRAIRRGEAEDLVMTH